MKQKLFKQISALLALVMLVSSASIAYAQDETAGTTTEADANTTSAPSAMALAGTASKEETVYVIAGADGQVEKVIVSDWLKNTSYADTIADKSDLQNIENVKGDESYTINPDGMKIWDAKGKDIYYQGTTDKALPVTLSVKYNLDGKAVSPEALAGKSGRVTIHIDYKNTEIRKVLVEGKQETMAVPFVMLSGCMLDNDKFRNITVSNGMVMNDGTRSIVLGFALPGMQDSLQLDRNQLELPESVEISADVTDFSLMTILTLATSDLFSDLDVDSVSELDTLEQKIEDLAAASKALVDGSSALYNGTRELLTKSGDLIAGVNALAQGAEQLKNGAGDLLSGATQLQTGITTLNQGLSTLTSNNDTLMAGAGTVFDTLLSTVTQQLTAAGLPVAALTRENYAALLDGIVANAAAYATAAAKTQVEAAIEAQSDTIAQGVSAAVQEQVLTAVLQNVAAQGLLPAMTAAEYLAAVDAGQIPQAAVGAVTQAVEQQMASQTIQATITQQIANTKAQLVQSNLQSEPVQAQIQAGTNQIATQVSGAKTQLASYQTFYDGLQEYTTGVATAAAGSNALADGSSQLTEGAGALAAGANTLSDGLNTLQSGNNALVDGVSQLNNGAMQLSQGMQKFDKEGISAITDAYQGDAKGLISRLHTLSNLAKEYKSFSGIADAMEGSVKFVYRTQSIGE